MWLKRARASMERQSSYRLLFDSHPQPMWVYDLKTLRFLLVNDAAIAYYGYTREEFLQMSIKDIRPAEDWPQLEDNLSQSANGLQRSGEWRHRLKDGRIVFVEILSNVINFDGRDARLVIANDVTTRRTLEQKILDSEERFRAVAHVTTDVIWDWSHKDDRTWYSDGLQKIFGHAPEVGDNGSGFWLDHIHPEDKPRVIQSTEDAIARRLPTWEDQYRFLRKDGSVAYVEDSARLIFDADGKIVRLVGGMTDISERKAAEARLSQQAALLDKAQDAIIVRDLAHRVLYWNQSAERIYGWTKAEAEGGSLVDLSSSGAEIFTEPTAITLARGEWTGRINRRRKDGSSLIIEGRWTLVQDAQGGPSSILAIETDVTKQVALEEQLLQAQRLEAIGQLTGGIAHDFNNLLTVILGNSELLIEQLRDDDPLRVLAEMTKTAAERGAELTRRLLAFARRQPLEPKVVPINTLLAEMRGLLGRTLTADISIELAPGDDVGNALVDPAQLEAAVLNLCINARDAMTDGGRLTIETANVALDDEYAEGNIEVAAGEYVVIAVSDTGSGITPDNLARVFEPFFTTKDVGKGTGLGLSMVYGFARQSGGHAKIYSEVGRGTTVKLYLPKMNVENRHSRTGLIATTAQGGAEAILLVEDDELVRIHVGSQLTALGYTVVAVVDGHEALGAIKQGINFDLLFTDIVMPGGMNGKQLADAVREFRPDLPILFTSGYAENAIAHQGQLDPGVSLLSKPYSRGDLARKVRAALLG